MKLLLIIVVLLLLIIVLEISLLFYKPYTKIAEKPDLKGIYVKNPDFIYSDWGWFSEAKKEFGNTTFYLDRFGETYWDGNGYYCTNECFENESKEGIVVLNGRYVYQNISIPEKAKNLNIYFGAMNLAGNAIFAPLKDSCDYVNFRVSAIKDDRQILLFSETLKERNWYHFKMPYKGPIGNVIIKIEWGPFIKNCKGQWLAIDYFDIY